MKPKTSSCNIYLGERQIWEFYAEPDQYEVPDELLADYQEADDRFSEIQYKLEEIKMRQNNEARTRRDD